MTALSLSLILISRRRDSFRHVYLFTQRIIVLTILYFFVCLKNFALPAAFLRQPVGAVWVAT